MFLEQVHDEVHQLQVRLREGVNEFLGAAPKLNHLGLEEGLLLQSLVQLFLVCIEPGCQLVQSVLQGAHVRAYLLAGRQRREKIEHRSRLMLRLDQEHVDAGCSGRGERDWSWTAGWRSAHLFGLSGGLTAIFERKVLAIVLG